MTQRRDVLKGIAGLASIALAGPAALAAPGKVRVTLVRWPYT